MKELLVDFNGFDQYGNLPLNPITIAKFEHPPKMVKKSASRMERYAR
jgi:hypothetical protein